MQRLGSFDIPCEVTIGPVGNGGDSTFGFGCCWVWGSGSCEAAARSSGRRIATFTQIYSRVDPGMGGPDVSGVAIALVAHNQERKCFVFRSQAPRGSTPTLAC